MKTTLLGASELSASRLAYGCWRIADRELTPAQGLAAVAAAVDAGYTLFDHADIYCDGEAEKVFGQALKASPGLRARILIASKCGIRKPNDPKPDAPYRYDFSGEYIVRSCEGSLRRLGVDCLDVYQLHRPDYLMAPAEVAAAFVKLQDTGKVHSFGVSNFKPSQVRALQAACPMRLLVNQVEISLAHSTCLEDGTLDQCLTDRLTPMAWSPLAGGKLGGGAKRVLPSQEGYRTELVVELLDALAKARGVTRAAVALAWLMKHPSGIIPIVGSTDPARIREAARADEIELSREEWYRLFVAGRGERLP